MAPDAIAFSLSVVQHFLSDESLNASDAIISTDGAVSGRQYRYKWHKESQLELLF
jgi:hypothetical protein